MNIEPQKEHQWLQKLVGEWTCEGEAMMEPGKPPVKWTTTESVRSLAGLWTLAESQGEMPGGGPSTTILTLAACGNSEIPAPKHVTSGMF